MEELMKNSINNPVELENIYRSNPKEFSRCFEELYNLNKESELLRYWSIRLQYEKQDIEQERNKDKKETNNYDYKKLNILVLILAIIVGFLVKLPSLIKSLDYNEYYTRNMGLIVLSSVAIYFMYVVRNKLLMKIGGIVFIFSAIYANLIPYSGRTDTIILFQIHLPLFLWFIIGMIFCGEKLKEKEYRINYIKFFGEFLIYCAITIIVGQVLVLLTAGLFSIIGVNIMSWYMEWVVICGASIVPVIVAHLCWTRYNDKNRILPIITKIFTPLFLITLIIYLINIIINFKEIFTNREFLIVFNVMLVIVLAISILNITEWKETKTVNKITNILNVSLLATSFIIDVIAISAIIFRLNSYGFTPNRIAVLGANIVMFFSISGLIYHLVAYLRGRIEINRVYRWIGLYAPVYLIWLGIVTFVFPLLYNFR